MKVELTCRGSTCGKYKFHNLDGLSPELYPGDAFVDMRRDVR